MGITGTVLVAAAYGVYAAFWVRFTLHLLVWWRARERPDAAAAPRRGLGPLARAGALLRAGGDILLFGRLFAVNPALWIGEWLFHLCFLLVGLRHLRFFLEPVPRWLTWMELPGTAAGWLLPPAAVYILVIRLLTRRERYSSRANLRLLVLVLVLAATGVALRGWHLVDVAAAKGFALGIVTFSPAPPPEGALFAAHVGLAFLLVAVLPSHIVTAPLVMLEARRRDQALHRILHGEEALVR